LDAWVRANAEKLALSDSSLVASSAANDEQEETEETPRFVPLPVRFGDGEIRFTESLKARFLFERPTRDKPRTILIRGAGGVGKTTLLLRLLVWVQEGLLGHPAIALLVDSENDPVLAHSDPLEGIKLRLVPISGADKRIATWFLRALLARGRIVLAFDHVSEFSDNAIRRIVELRHTVTAEQVLVTSRTRIDLVHSTTLEIVPALLSAVDIHAFVGQILPQDELQQAEQAGEAIRQAAAFIRHELGEGAKVPALVVWLFVKQMRRARFREADAPSSMANLYFDYVRYHVAKANAPGDVVDVLHALRRIASESVQLDGTIRELEETFVRDALKVAASNSLERLITGGLLIRKQSQAVSRVRFALDPVSEHLAMQALALQTEVRARELSSVSVAWSTLWKTILSDDLRQILCRVVCGACSAYGFASPTDFDAATSSAATQVDASVTGGSDSELLNTPDLVKP
jgi:hypothetical protein